MAGRSQLGSGDLDAIARELASGGISRRSALKRLAGSALAAGVASVPGAEALASRARCPAERKCGDKCCPRHSKCRRGKCKCNEGYTKCDGKCVDLQASRRHCGKCGNRCAEGQVCSGGECLTPVCEPGQTQPCYTGPPGTENVGVCQGGVRTCNVDGTAYGACEGQVTPGTEICGSGDDEDCDGAVDEGCCTPDCIGKDCGDDGCGGQCGTCSTGEICNGSGICETPTTGCPGEGQPCSVGIGACQRSGVLVCDQEGNAVCSATPGQASQEICNNIDDDCDGSVDDNPSDAGGACSCGETAGVIICQDGTLFCTCPGRKRALT